MNAFSRAPAAPKLPEKLESLGEVKRELHPLFEADPNTLGWRLNQAGRQLQRLRIQREADEHAPYVAPAKPLPITARDWSALVGAAAPDEKKALLQFAAAGRYRVER